MPILVFFSCKISNINNNRSKKERKKNRLLVHAVKVHNLIVKNSKHVSNKNLNLNTIFYDTV